MLRMAVVALLMSLSFILSALPGFGESIVLNGSFGDWAGKPSLSDPQGDEAPALDIGEVRWYPDNDAENLYLYVSNTMDAATGVVPRTWKIKFHIQAEGRRFTAQATVNRINRMVSISLLNGSGRQIWAGKGKWTDAWGKRVECGIPLSRILTSTEGGYEIELHISSGEDSVPDEGAIIISSISTYGAVNLLAVCGIVFAVRHKCGRKACFL